MRTHPSPSDASPRARVEPAPGGRRPQSARLARGFVDAPRAGVEGREDPCSRERRVEALRRAYLAGRLSTPALIERTARRLLGAR